MAVILMGKNDENDIYKKRAREHILDVIRRLNKLAEEIRPYAEALREISKAD